MWGFQVKMNFIDVSAKSGKMADLETLTPSVSLNSSQMYTFFCKDLTTGYCLYIEKIRVLTAIRFQIDFITHTLLLWG